MMKKIVITGISTGIGYSTAKILCNSGYLVYGSFRKESDAKKTKNDFGENFTPLIFDVTDKKSIHENAALVKNELKPGEILSGLVITLRASQSKYSSWSRENSRTRIVLRMIKPASPSSVPRR